MSIQKVTLMPVGPLGNVNHLDLTKLLADIYKQTPLSDDFTSSHVGTAIHRAAGFYPTFDIIDKPEIDFEYIRSFGGDCIFSINILHDPSRLKMNEDSMLPHALTVRLGDYFPAGKIANFLNRWVTIIRPTGGLMYKSIYTLINSNSLSRVTTDNEQKVSSGPLFIELLALLLINAIQENKSDAGDIMIGDLDEYGFAITIHAVGLKPYIDILKWYQYAATR